jgi:hypothetical protein
MNEKEFAMPDMPVRTRTEPQAVRTWPQAFVAWVKDGHTSLILKILLGYGPVAILNDLIPGIGFLDNLYLPVWIIVLVVVFIQVSSYRYAPQTKK